MGSTEKDDLRIDKFRGDNFRAWKFKVRLLLEKDEIYGFVNGDEVLGANANAQQRRAFQKKDRKAFAVICLHLDDAIIPLVQEKDTSKEAWDALCSRYEEQSMASRLFIRKEIYALELQEAGNMETHLNKLTTLFGQLSAAGTQVSEDEKITIALTSVPKSYDSVVVALETKTDDLTWEFVTQRLLHEHKKHRSEKPKSAEEQALMGAGAKKGIKGPNAGTKPPPKSDGAQADRGGHGEGGKAPPKSQGHLAHTQDEDKEEVLCAGSTNEGESTVWFVDSGATQHMTHLGQCLENYRPISGPKLMVEIANGEEVPAHGKATVRLQVKNADGRILRLDDVLYVPGLKKNLLSVSVMTARGVDCLFQGSQCLLKRGEKFLATAVKKGKLYQIQTENVREECSVAKGLSMDTWHRRLGHLHEQGVQALKEMADGLTLTGPPVLEKCVGCIEGKMARLPFPDSTSTTANVLDVIHTDVCGPMSVESVSRKRYFVTFIDDSSHMCFVYFIRSKDEVPVKLQEFHAMTKNQTGRSIKVLRSDRGGEYVSEKMLQFCTSEGIVHQKTVPNTPQQNGKAERMNRTLLNSARSMLSHAGLPLRYWAEAIMAAAYTRNRCPTSTVPKMTPVQAWTGKKPDVQNLRVFGCICYAKITDNGLKKLDKRAVKCIFLGYPTDSKGYRLLEIESTKLIFSRDVEFMEDQFMKDRDPSAVSLLVETGLRKASEVPVPGTLKDALSSDDRVQWTEAMTKEYQSLMDNGTWVLSDLPKGRNPVGCKWTFKVKANSDGSIERFKARVVAKGFLQKAGIDFKETFAPVVRLESIRVVLALAVQKGWFIHQMDVSTAFLNGDLEEEIFMRQPEGFVQKGEEDKVCRLVKSLYGLKQAPRCWNQKLTDYLCKVVGASKTSADSCIFTWTTRGSLVIISVYVDDLVLASENLDAIEDAKSLLQKKFKLRDLGEIDHLLGMRIQYDRINRKMTLDQQVAIEELLSDQRMKDCKPAATPILPGTDVTRSEHIHNQGAYQSAVGSLIYIATATRPDLAESVGILSQHMASPGTQHWSILKQALRYLKATAPLKLVYGGQEGCRLEGYCDADWGGNKSNRRSTSGYLFKLGESSITWSSKLQTTVALSTTEAEYMAACHAAKEAVWLRRLLKEMDESQKDPTTIYQDNQGCIALAGNPVKHGRTKHIDIQYHFVREKVISQELVLTYCPTDAMVADIFTKPLTRNRFQELRTALKIE